MIIYIPTRGRLTRQTTFNALPPSLQAQAIFVVDSGKGVGYAGRYPTAKGVMELPSGLKGIAFIRQYIMEHCDEQRLVMLDDDLTLFVKNEERKIVGATPIQVEDMFKELEHWLHSGFAHAGITPRFLNWQDTADYKDATRMMHVLAYDRYAVNAAGARFTAGVDSTFSMDDFHMTLQLLRAGCPNRVSLSNCTSPSASNSTGGASEWRTTATHNASAERLAELHPGFVKVKVKQDWKGMGGGERKDVTVQWQKALKR